MLFRSREYSDAEIVRAVLQGRSQRFALLVDRYKNLVYSTLLARVRQQDEADDLAQETFLKAFRQLDTLEDPRKFGPWVRQIATHQALNFLRDRSRQQVSAEELDLPPPKRPDQVFAAQEERQRIWQAIGQLSEDHREIILLFYMEEYSVQQIASFLELQPGSAKMRLRRARETLREQLEEEFDRKVKQAVKEKGPDKAFTRKIMSVLPLVPWNLRQPPNTLGQMGWALGTVLTGVVGLMVFGMIQGWWPERKDPGMAVQWVRSQEPGPEVDPSAVDQQAGLVGWVNGIEGGGDQPSLFGGQGLSTEAQELQAQALQHGWGGRLAWEFEEGTEGWIAREGNYSYRPPDLLPTRASNGVLRIDLGPYLPGRVPVVELISPEIGYDSRLFERVEVRARVIHPTSPQGRISMAWTNPLNRLFPGKDPGSWERRTEEDQQAYEKRQRKINYSPFALWDLPPVDFSSGWRNIAISGLGERAQARWEGDLVDLRLSFMLAEFRSAAEVAPEQFPQALEIDRIVLSHGHKPINQSLILPKEPVPNTPGQWLGEGSFYPVNQPGLKWPVLGDLDGDGDLDLVLSWWDRPNHTTGLSSGINTGQGVFRFRPLVANTPTADEAFIHFQFLPAWETSMGISSRIWCTKSKSRRPKP